MSCESLQTADRPAVPRLAWSAAPPRAAYSRPVCDSACCHLPRLPGTVPVRVNIPRNSNGTRTWYRSINNP